MKLTNPFKNRLFVDELGKTVYYDEETRIAYHLSEKDKSRYDAFQSRPVFGISVGILMTGVFHLPFWLAAVAAIASDILMAVYMYDKFIPSLPQRHNVSPNKLTPYAKKAPTKETRLRAILKTFCFFAIAVLLVINAYQEQYHINEPLTFYASLFLAFGSLAMSCKCVFDIFKH